jgi:hypothetical protein
VFKIQHKEGRESAFSSNLLIVKGKKEDGPCSITNIHGAPAKGGIGWKLEPRACDLAIFDYHINESRYLFLCVKASSCADTREVKSVINSRTNAIS